MKRPQNGFSFKAVHEDAAKKIRRQRTQESLTLLNQQARHLVEQGPVVIRTSGGFLEGQPCHGIGVFRVTSNDNDNLAGCLYQMADAPDRFRTYEAVKISVTPDGEEVWLFSRRYRKAA